MYVKLPSGASQGGSMQSKTHDKGKIKERYVLKTY